MLAGDDDDDVSRVYVGVDACEPHAVVGEKLRGGCEERCV